MCEMGADDELDDCACSFAGELAELLLEERPQQGVNLEDPLLSRHEEAEPVTLGESVLGVVPEHRLGHGLCDR